MFEGIFKAFTEEEGLKIFESFQLYGVPQAKIFQRKRNTYSTPPHMCEEKFRRDMPYFWNMLSKFWTPTVCCICA
jgi:hypothetical protein